MKKYFVYGVVLIVAVSVLAGLKWGSKFNTGSTTLSWNANTESNLAGYKIYYGTTPRKDVCPKDNKGGYTEVIDVKKNTSFKIKNMKRNTEYYFSTTSYNSEGKESCFSQEVSKKIN